MSDDAGRDSEEFLPWTPNRVETGDGSSELDENGFQILYSSGREKVREHNGFVPFFEPPPEPGREGPAPDLPQEAAPDLPPHPEPPPPPPGPDPAAIAEIEREAREKGYAEGEKAGYAAGEARALEVVQRLEDLLSEIGNLWPSLVATCEDQIISLVARAVEKVVMGQAAVDEDMVRRAILHAFELIPEPSDVTVHVSPEDYQYIETVREDFFRTVGDLQHLSIVSDPAVEKGGCRVYTESGEVDARLEARLEAVQSSLLAARGAGGSAE